MTTTRIALATSTLHPQLIEDDRLLVPLLAARGIEAVPLVWTEPGDERFDLVVVRSTWDYVPQRERFVAWADAQPRLRNSAAILRWNTDKRYLGELAAAGAPVVPTTFVAPGEPYSPPAFDHVVKPTVSAGTRDTARFAGDAEGAAASRAHTAALHAACRTAMVQPYIASVDARGESALIFFDGELSHAIHKPALLPRASQAIQSAGALDLMKPRAATADEKAVAERILEAVPGGRRALSYARVDLVLGDDGRPMLLELEATEPYLFLGLADGSAARFADAIVRALG
jgi:hypothetical protein